MADLTATVFTGAQVKAYCDRLLADGDGFLAAAAKATELNSAAPLAVYFRATGWDEVQEQTMLVLCRSFRRFAAANHDLAAKVVMEIRDNCDKAKGEGHYVHW